MATFIGFNTIGQNKQFTMIDFELIKIDLLNAFNIRQGELVGRPGYGTTIWNYVFENQSAETNQAIYNEVQRVVAQDPRIYLNSIQVFNQSNGVRIQLFLQVVNTATAQQLTLMFDQGSSTTYYTT